MIETKRLTIVPLNYHQIIKYLKLDNSLEKELNLNISSRTISLELKEAIEKTILPNVVNNSNNYFYSTLWTGISKAENKMVGDICFYCGSIKKEIEIGYGTYNEFQGMGYMTEMIAGIIARATTQSLIQSIIATTHNTNQASFRVLQNNNFVHIATSDLLLHWKLELK